MKPTLKIGVFFHSDFTFKGTNHAENRGILRLFEIYSEKYEVEAYAILLAKKKKRKNSQIFLPDYPFSTIEIDSQEDIPVKLKELDLVYSIPHVIYMFGGMVTKKEFLMHQVHSWASTERKLLLRMSDSKLRLEDFKVHLNKRKEKLKPENYPAIEKLWDMNWDGVYWIANGTRRIDDWVKRILYHGMNEDRRFVKPETLDTNIIYMGDDIFFDVNDLFNKNSDLPTGYREDRSAFPIFVGYINRLDFHRAKYLKKYFMKNPEREIDVHPGPDNYLRFEAPNVHTDITLLDASSPDYFNRINKHSFFFFVGKGIGDIYYCHKTIYDTLIARTPVVVPRDEDQKGRVFPIDAFWRCGLHDYDDVAEMMLDPYYRQLAFDQQKEIVWNLMTRPDEVKENKELLWSLAPNKIIFQDKWNTANKIMSTISLPIELQGNDTNRKST